MAVNCYPPYGIGPPTTDDWNVCYQGSSVPVKKSAAEICREIKDQLGSISASSLGSNGAMRSRSSGETTHGRWMKTPGEIGCGWGSTLGGDFAGFRIKREEKSVSDEDECCLHAMSFEGSPWTEGGSAVRFQYSPSDGMCRVDRETMVRGNLDRSSGLALRDTTLCGAGTLYWRHATGGADAANLKGETLCQANNNFLTFTGSAAVDSSVWDPVGALPDHFTGNWGNELPNHACDKWPHGDCKGVMGFNNIASPEQCCQECVSLKWVSALGGDTSKTTVDGKEVFSNPCVAWQIVGGKCRILREHMVLEHPSFKGKTVKQALESNWGGAPCRQTLSGTGTYDVETQCNYYSFIRYRESSKVVPPNNATLGSDGVSNATFSKRAVIDIFEGADDLDELLQMNATTLKVTTDVTSMANTGTSSRVSTIQNHSLDNVSSSTSSGAVMPNSADNSTCAKVRLFSSEDFAIFTNGKTSLEGSATPWCESNTCAMSGSTVSLECNATTLLLKAKGRRLADGRVRRLSSKVPKVVISFDSDGTGKDNMLFDGVSITKSGPSPSSVSPPSSSSSSSTSSNTAATMKTTTSLDDKSGNQVSTTASIGGSTSSSIAVITAGGVVAKVFVLASIFA